MEGTAWAGLRGLACGFWPPVCHRRHRVEEIHTSCCVCLSLALTQFTLAVPGGNLGLVLLAILLSGFSLEGGQVRRSGRSCPETWVKRCSFRAQATSR